MLLSISELEAALLQLSADRPVFHSEADFQFALAWQLRENHSDVTVRLEYKPVASERIYIDVWLSRGVEKAAIELKYATRALQVTVGGEDFSLRHQAAQDLTRYDFIRDVVRVERVVQERDHSVGFAVLLTNDTTYWREPLRDSSIDAAFRIAEGRRLSGTLGWAANTSAGTQRGRETDLSLLSEYIIGWREYSSLPGSYGRFRYVMLEARRPAQATLHAPTATSTAADNPPTTPPPP
jgi:hypothetical protein